MRRDKIAVYAEERDFLKWRTFLRWCLSVASHARYSPCRAYRLSSVPDARVFAITACNGNYLYLSQLRRDHSQILVSALCWQCRLEMLMLSAVPTGLAILATVPTDKSVGYFHLSLRDKIPIYKKVGMHPTPTENSRQKEVLYWVPSCPTVAWAFENSIRTLLWEAPARLAGAAYSMLFGSFHPEACRCGNASWAIRTLVSIMPDGKVLEDWLLSDLSGQWYCSKILVHLFSWWTV